MPYKNREKQLESQRKNYFENKERYKNSLRTRIERNKQFVNEYKKDKKCSRCPENRSICLHFHHIKRQTANDKGVSILVRNGSSIDRIVKEIEKCELLCANCHLVEHNGNTWDKDSVL